MNCDRLREYQVAPTLAMQTAFERWGSALNGSDTGTGKTYSTCALLRHYDAPTVVVAPPHLLPTWKRAGDYMGVEFDVIGYEKLRTGRMPFGRWEIKERRHNKRPIRKFHWAPEVKCVVFDEAHRCKSLVGGLNSAMMIGARRSGIPTLALTATPGATPLDFKALGYLLGLHNGSDFYPWMKRHGCVKDFMGGTRFGGTREDQEAIMEKLRRDIFPEHGVRVQKKDIPGFPTTQILPELYSLDHVAEINEVYAMMEKELAALAERAAQDQNPEAAVRELLRMRQQVELLKVPLFKELAWDEVQQGRHVIIFVNFRETATALSRLMGHLDHRLLMGGMSKRAVTSTVDSFQADEYPLLITVSQISGLGFGFHDVRGEFPRSSLISPGWSALDFEQLVGRVCRDGALSHSIQRVVLAAGTVEENVFGRMTQRYSTQSALRDEDFIPFRQQYPTRFVEKEDFDFGVDIDPAPGVSSAPLTETNPDYEDSDIPF